MFLIVYYLIVSALAAACSGSDNNCAEGQCDVTIGDKTYCSQCATGYVPINGVCTVHTNSAGISAAGCKVSGKDPTATSVKCEQCDAAKYFLYKGGCYSTADAPGNLMCKTVTTNGICSQAADTNKYFVPPGADASHDSVVACNDTTEITLTDGKKYVGVDKCKTCTAPTNGNTVTPTAATCTECSAELYLKTATGATPPSCVGASECGKGLFPTTVSNVKTCVSCGTAANGGIENCAECTAPATSGSSDSNQKAACTKCASPKYLKSDGTCGEASECTGTTFPKADTSAGNKCVACSTAADGGIADCTECTPIPQASRAGTVAITCSKCGTKKVSPDKSSCVATCPENSNDDKTPNVCVCRDGFSLEGGKCVPPNTNRSALSTGAIAGISVAAVVVVGGLVGFLCWWFICRGKA